MRTPFVAGNWKMNLTKAQAVSLASSLAAKSADFGGVEVAIIPAFVHLDAVSVAIKGSPIRLGAQNVYFEKNGAFTGEISAAMLQDLGVSYVLVGHSERRHVMGEQDSLLNRKLKAIIDAGMTAILCIGETLDERKSESTLKICERQLREGLAGVGKEKAAQLVIAYEPVWAIGTGLNATPAQAQEVHKFTREKLAEIFDAPAAAAIRIQYGGSVKPANAGELMTQPDIDGALVGGASLKVDDFIGIIKPTAQSRTI